MLSLKDKKEDQRRTMRLTAANGLVKAAASGSVNAVLSHD